MCDESNTDTYGCQPVKSSIDFTSVVMDVQIADPELSKPVLTCSQMVEVKQTTPDFMPSLESSTTVCSMNKANQVKSSDNGTSNEIYCEPLNASNDQSIDQSNSEKCFEVLINTIDDTSMECIIPPGLIEMAKKKSPKKKRPRVESVDNSKVVKGSDEIFKKTKKSKPNFKKDHDQKNDKKKKCVPSKIGVNLEEYKNRSLENIIKVPSDKGLENKLNMTINKENKLNMPINKENKLNMPINGENKLNMPINEEKKLNKGTPHKKSQKTPKLKNLKVLVVKLENNMPINKENTQKIDYIMNSTKNKSTLINASKNMFHQKQEQNKTGIKSQTKLNIYKKKRRKEKSIKEPRKKTTPNVKKESSKKTIMKLSDVSCNTKRKSLDDDSSKKIVVSFDELSNKKSSDSFNDGISNKTMVSLDDLPDIHNRDILTNKSSNKISDSLNKEVSEKIILNDDQVSRNKIKKSLDKETCNKKISTLNNASNCNKSNVTTYKPSKKIIDTSSLNDKSTEKIIKRIDEASSGDKSDILNKENSNNINETLDDIEITEEVNTLDKKPETIINLDVSSPIKQNDLCKAHDDKTIENGSIRTNDLNNSLRNCIGDATSTDSKDKTNDLHDTPKNRIGEVNTSSNMDGDHDLPTNISSSYSINTTDIPTQKEVKPSIKNFTSQDITIKEEPLSDLEGFESEHENVSSSATFSIDSVSEELIVEWLIYMAKIGCQVTPQDFQEAILRFDSNFQKNDEGPLSTWQEFKKRNRDLPDELPEQFCAKRKIITETAVRQWFRQVTIVLRKEAGLRVRKILTIEHSDRVFNIDEYCFPVKNGNVDVNMKSLNNIYRRSPDDRTQITALACVNGIGETFNPLVVFPNENPDMPFHEHPSGRFSLTESKNGWITPQLFLDWLETVFYPTLVKKNTQFPVVIFLDSSVAHIDPIVYRFCKEKKIHFICFPVHTSNILQPLNSFFAAFLHEFWINIYSNYKSENAKDMDTNNFIPYFVEILDAFNGCKSDISALFQETGLIPFSSVAVDYSRLGRAAASIHGMAVDKNVLLGLHMAMYSISSAIPREKLYHYKRGFDEQYSDHPYHKDDAWKMYESLSRMIENYEYMSPPDCNC